MIHDSVEQASQKQGGCPSSGGGNAAAAAEQRQEMIKSNLARIKNKILVMSGKGGVGKSSVSANLAVTLAEKGFKVGLMDVDLHGPSIAQVMGLEGLLDISEDQKLIPVSKGDNLKVVSMQSLMQDKDQAVIWRGPAKGSMIQQFIGIVDWGDLDFLVIDAPPGTGDEPLTVVQTIPEAKAVVVTTPQEVALADVRKSLNFCNTVKLDTLGVVENMGPLKCPCCNHEIELFKNGGGKKMADDMGINFLGSIPFDPEVVRACDAGTPIVTEQKESPFTKALEKIASNIVGQL